MFSKISRTLRLAAALAWGVICIGATEPFETLSEEDARVREIGSQIFASDGLGQAGIEQLVTHLTTTQQLPEPVARVLAHRKLGAYAIEIKKWGNATSHLTKAEVLATELEDATALIEVKLASIHPLVTRGDRETARIKAEQAWELARRIGRPDLQVEAGIRLTEIYYLQGQSHYHDHYFETMLALPGADALRIREHWAAVSAGLDYSLQEQRWQEVALLARAGGKPSILARAIGRLALFALRRGELDQGLAFFVESRELDPDRFLPPALWLEVSQAYQSRGDTESARQALDSAIAANDEAGAPEVIAGFEDERAAVLAQLGDYEEAYEALRKSQNLRGVNPRQIAEPPRVRMIPMIKPEERVSAEDLAAVRAALREAELEQSRLGQRMALGAGIAALLLAVAFGVAFAYKRRAATALATARDAAELRAENARLVALRHQLNPHFLFNALNSLRSRVFAGREDSTDLIDRLTAFCRQALQDRSDGIVTIREERTMLAAFLDIEKTRWEENLEITLSFDEAADERPIPTLLLLPLVENALKYGAQTSEETIRITAAICMPDSDTIEVVVHNSGRWVEPGRAQRRTSNRVGLDNIRERLQRQYPDRHSFEVGPEEDGVTARLVLKGSPQQP